MVYEIEPRKRALRWTVVVDTGFVDIAMQYAKPDATEELPEKLLRDVEGYPAADAAVALAFVLSQLAYAVCTRAVSSRSSSGEDVFTELVKAVSPQ